MRASYAAAAELDSAGLSSTDLAAHSLKLPSRPARKQGSQLGSGRLYSCSAGLQNSRGKRCPAGVPSATAMLRSATHHCCLPLLRLPGSAA